jgi:hypothetical protein
MKFLLFIEIMIIFFNNYSTKIMVTIVKEILNTINNDNQITNKGFIYINDCSNIKDVINELLLKKVSVKDVINDMKFTIETGKYDYLLELTMEPNEGYKYQRQLKTY